MQQFWRILGCLAGDRLVAIQKPDDSFRNDTKLSRVDLTSNGMAGIEFSASGRLNNRRNLLGS